MIWFRLKERRSAKRVAAVGDLQFPASGRQHLTNRYHHLSGDNIHLVEVATRQWFRLLARNPRESLIMPSLVVDDLWQAVAMRAREYAAFCDAAFGRPLIHRPRFTMTADADSRERAALLVATLGHARKDEGGAPALPLLFRVDEELRIPDGNRYLADCGGRGECFHVPGTICLQHVRGPGKRVQGGGIRGDLPFADGRYGYAGGAFLAGGGVTIESTGVGGGDGGGGN
ncbi:hypothetical protein [Phytohabitans houttuyneae]|uniref:Uncharacterized protein n=1 Tax=Phytohabitans houttuyneae TaxID=1076126 RepID=A0A6V8KAV8_9ACTN|nr:hypothetical protein [Phytohabitans houttuyneae]GFJ80894.1 hypothetical protein Phou_050740 [Phytohabitans houttuyneae]